MSSPDFVFFPIHTKISTPANPIEPNQARSFSFPVYNPTQAHSSPDPPAHVPLLGTAAAPQPYRAPCAVPDFYPRYDTAADASRPAAQPEALHPLQSNGASHTDERHPPAHTGKTLHVKATHCPSHTDTLLHSTAHLRSRSGAALARTPG